MTPTPADHLLALILVLGVPLWGTWEYGRLRAELARGRPDARIRSYREGLAVEWALTLLLLAGWWAADRDASLLGLDAPSGKRALLFWAMALSATAGASFQAVLVWRSPEARARARAHFEGLEALLPHTLREARWFTALGLTAGACEELLYRGFLMAWLGAYMAAWPAAIVAAVGFGIAHAYQGMGGVLKTGLLGLVFGAMVVLTGSIWVPVVVHAAIDVVNGWTAQRILGSASE